jgi:tRNA nucleotidyltransferase/poly(A) polymerase
MIDPGIINILKKLQDFLAGNRVKGYLVGGFVRDSLLQRRTADIDIAVTADALLTAQAAAMCC